MHLRAPAAVVFCVLASARFADAQAVAARPVPFTPATMSWGFVLRHFFESDFAKTAPLSPLLQALQPLDLIKPDPRLLAGPLASALATAAPTPGAFASLPEARRLELLEAAASAARRDAVTRAAAVVSAGLPDDAVADAAPLAEQLAGPLGIYLSNEAPPGLAKAVSELRSRLEELRRTLPASLERQAEALGGSREPETPYLRARRATSPAEAARLAREFSWSLRRSGSLETRREYVSAFWELAETQPSKASHRIAASALIRELGLRRRRTEKHRIHVLRAMRALADRTPYESVERRLVGAALDESARAVRDGVAREADFTAEAVATVSPFPSVRRLAARSHRESLSWTGDEDRRRDLERRIERLEQPVRTDWWPSWKPPRPPSWRDRLATLLRGFHGN